MRISIEWLKDFVDARFSPEKLATSLTMAGVEVEAIDRAGEDVIFELGVTPNRSDCLSAIGVAREISAVTETKFKEPSFRAPLGRGKISEVVKIRIRNSQRCPRYLARVVRGVKIGPSPAWIARRLSTAGVRAINNIVDATNYVMIETGQPLHAFDLRFINGGEICVRIAGEDTKFKTLDGEERKLVKDDLLICDCHGPVALAGVMGGENSQVSDTTVDILLESAFFEPTGIRRTSKRLGLASESSRRFERGVDPNGALGALHRLTDIILQTAGGMPSADWVDVYPKKIQPKRLSLGESEVLRILGRHVSAAGIAKHLKDLGFQTAVRGKGKVSVRVPTFRPDITRPIDLIEEVARVGGYDKIPETMPVAAISPISRPRFYEKESVVRAALVDAGFSEAVLYGFMSEESLKPFAELSRSFVKVTNPISAEQAAMRTTLLPGLLDALKLNFNRQCADMRIFALQRIYCGDASSADEPRILAGVLTGRRFPNAWERSKETVDFYDAKGAVEAVFSSQGLGGRACPPSEERIRGRRAVFERGDEYSFMHPGSFARVACDGKQLGFVGQIRSDTAALWEIDKDVYAFELRFEEMAEFSGGVAKFRELCRYPFVERDIAIVVSEAITAAEVEGVVKNSGIEMLEGVRMFDVYRGKGIEEGHKGIAFTMRFSRNDGTLTDEEVNAAFDKVLDELKRKLGAKLRM